MWGPVELVGIIAGPVFLLFLIIIIVFLVINYHQRVYHNRQRLDMEDPSCEMCLSKDKTLQDLVYDLSTSGSGSGTRLAPCVGPHSWLPAGEGVYEEAGACCVESFAFIILFIWNLTWNKIRYGLTENLIP